ncbi:MAG: amino acid transporter substrate-binding protein [Aeromicrobium sp.]|jgi:ABC-type branched-subunit amino acid transport system substrate-binding protein|nr:amino acid transporter substrate-binding protein [Aeromicrobium sp.]
MKRSTTTIRLAAVAAAGALVLAACGGGSDSDGKSTDKTAAKGDGTLTIGQLLPQTGSLAYLGPPEFAGSDLAIKDINAAGGVNGKDVVGVKADSGDTDSGIAPAETDKLLKAKSDVIIGAASSGVSLTVIDKIMSAGVVEFSPANTSTSFDEGDYSKPDLYFRTAPSDILQGAVLANLLVEDGKQNVAILARQDAYGETLSKEVSKNLKDAGSTVAASVLYSEKNGPGDSQITEIANAKADAVLLIGFEETTTIIPKLIQAGTGPQDVPTYFVDGNTANYGKGDAASLPDGTLKGTKGTIPGAKATEDFRKRLATVDDNLKDYAYSAESYDSTVVSALAAIVAGDDSGTAIAKEIPGVTTGGEKCDSFEACAKLLKDDPKTDIDYDGVSGPIELGKTGSPTAASIGIYQYDDKNKISPVKYISGNI